MKNKGAVRRNQLSVRLNDENVSIIERAAKKAKLPATTWAHERLIEAARIETA